MKKADVTVDQSIADNLQTFTYEIGSEWEQSSIDAVDEFDKYTAKKEVVELGCGDGAAVRRFIELGYRVTGVDINPQKLSKIKGADVIESDILAYLKRLPDNSVENIFTHHALEHCVHADKILLEIGRVLRGACCIVVPDDGVHSVHHVSFESPNEIAIPGTNPIRNGAVTRHLNEFWYIGEKGDV